MATLDAVNASDVDEDAERWNDREQEILRLMAGTPGGLSDLLAKIIIIVDRSEDACWNLLSSERDLLASMRDQAETMLLNGGGRA